MYMYIMVNHSWYYQSHTWWCHSGFDVTYPALPIFLKNKCRYNYVKFQMKMIVWTHLCSYYIHKSNFSSPEHCQAAF